MCSPGAPAGTLGTVSRASACGEVSAAYTVVTSAFGNGASLVALWCILVSMLKSEALYLWCFFCSGGKTTSINQPVGLNCSKSLPSHTCAIAMGFICSQSTKETSKLFLLSISQQCVCLVQGNAQETPPKHWAEETLAD